ncbi:MAG: hypothetical protein KGL39_24500 [Patescibacteria group bacterium]|nr:hypothetical protein [Patescibacteria group bacterium]
MSTLDDPAYIKLPAPKPRPGGHKKERRQTNPAPTGRFEITVPQCKICGLNPHVRWNIEMELATGYTQKAIMDRWNYFLHEEDPDKYGKDYLNKANISGHANKHMTTREMAIRHIVEQSVQGKIEEIEAVSQVIITKQAIAEAVAVSGLQNIAKGVTLVEPRETLEAVELLKEMEDEQSGPALDELWRQFYAFQDAVRRIVPEQMYEAIAHEFDIQMRGAPPEPEVTGELVQGQQLLDNLDEAAERVITIIEESDLIE